MPEALWGWPPPVLDPAGPYADSVTLLAWVLLAMGVLVTAIVVAALWIALRGPERLKRKLGGEKTVWIGGIAFPAVVLTGLLVWGLMLTASLSRDITGDEMRVRVTGEMWWFRVEYLDRAGNVVLRDANELHLPVGRPVVLELRSADVAMVLYPLSAFRAMNKAAEAVYTAIRRDGTQKNVLGTMQTRDDLYDRIGYHRHEQHLDALFSAKK